MLRISIATEYQPEHSEPAQGQYVFHYQIEIHNDFDQPVTLQRRYWLITDGNGKQTEVDGVGVVGQTPTIAANDSFSYRSAVVLETPIGLMQGHYQLTGANGAFNSPIAPFQLCQPGALH
ncbi:Co2+/Mg2+ efflux protein ApaG [Ferrimonas senticii]|uniref:Co2+/Mg2+ efflux protein ApaG n=1 Tax=Ferrimonas senticii TaxID=394566 RepID=UPI00041AC03F|nr:Co2+/Mg2+ efflux protein ApaG [Ferrimonas senticii]